MKHEKILLGCWAALMLLTLGTVYWGSHAGSLLLQVLVILVIAVIKAGVIIDGFMELWHAPGKWRLVMYGWPVVMALVIAATLLL
ncbi:MAG: cytochrome C oxidase subunit IV family protein [Gammaproteobacteria bacterium]|nr:cytochrome C oxidase subunit IV family protein [Gammaproteobacteria bacterium]